MPKNNPKNLSYSQLVQLEGSLNRAIAQVKKRQQLIISSEEQSEKNRKELSRLAGKRNAIGAQLREVSELKSKKRDQRYEKAEDAKFNYFFTIAAFKLLPRLLLEKIKSKAFQLLKEESTKMGVAATKNKPIPKMPLTNGTRR